MCCRLSMKINKIGAKKLLTTLKKPKNAAIYSQKLPFANRYTKYASGGLGKWEVFCERNTCTTAACFYDFKRLSICRSVQFLVLG